MLLCHHLHRHLYNINQMLMQVMHHGQQQISYNLQVDGISQ